MIVDDKYYIDRMILGDQSAFESIYRRYVGRIYNFTFDLLKSTDQTKDLVQDVFVSLWENRSKINSSLSFKSYLFTIAHHRILNEFRKQINSTSYSDYVEYCDSVYVEDEKITQAIDYDQFKIKLVEAKTKLTDRQRQIFELYVEQGVSVSEIAALLHINPQTIRNSVAQSRTILKKELKNYVPFLAYFLYIATH